VRDGLVKAVIHQVSSGHRGVQPGPLTIRVAQSVQVIQRRLQRAHAGIQALAEQVGDRGHARRQRGRRTHLTGAEGQLMSGPVSLGSGRVVIGGRGLVAQCGEQCGPVQHHSRCKSKLSDAIQTRRYEPKKFHN
jgi:hypothetical protein